MCLAECWHLQGFVRLEVAQMPSKTLTTPLGVSVQKKCKWMYTWSGGIKTWNFETFWKDVCVLKPIGFALIHEALSCWEICAAFIPLLGAKLSQKRMGGKLVSSSNGFTLDGGQVGWQRGHLPSKNPCSISFSLTGRKCVLYQRPVVVTWPSVTPKSRTPAYIVILDPVLLILGQHSISYSFSKRKHSISDGDAYPTSSFVNRSESCHWRLKNCKPSKRLFLFPYFIKIKPCKLEGHTYITGFVLLYNFTDAPRSSGLVCSKCAPGFLFWWHFSSTFFLVDSACCHAILSSGTSPKPGVFGTTVWSFTRMPLPE